MTLYRPSNARFRAAVYAHDKGVCSECGLDTMALAEKYRDAEAKDAEDAKGSYLCLTCDHIGSSRPCEECRGRLLQTVSCFERRAAVTAEARTLGFKAIEFITLMKSKRSLWVADHRVPLEAGGEDTIENGRTLCVPCNHRVTGAQTRERNKRLAKARKPKNEARAIVRAMRGFGK